MLMLMLLLLMLFLVSRFSFLIYCFSFLVSCFVFFVACLLSLVLVCLFVSCLLLFFVWFCFLGWKAFDAPRSFQWLCFRCFVLMYRPLASSPWQPSMYRFRSWTTKIHMTQWIYLDVLNIIWIYIYIYINGLKIVYVRIRTFFIIYAICKYSNMFS